jgi:hypothetical protein
VQQGGAIIGFMPQAPGGNPERERAIVGALRAAIHDHGHITLANVLSAARRVVGNLANANASGLARALGRRRAASQTAAERVDLATTAANARWKGTTKAERKRAAPDGAAGGTKAWAGMSPDERSAEMKRRAQVRAANRTKKAST